MSILSKPYFHDEEAAFAFLEGLLWPEGPVCAHCGAMDKLYKIEVSDSLEPGEYTLTPEGSNQVFCFQVY